MAIVSLPQLSEAIVPIDNRLPALSIDQHVQAIAALLARWNRLRGAFSPVALVLFLSNAQR